MHSSSISTTAVHCTVDKQNYCTVPGTAVLLCVHIRNFKCQNPSFLFFLDRFRILHSTVTHRPAAADSKRVHDVTAQGAFDGSLHR